MHYIISLKWTFPDSGAFTFWRKNGNGYCWYREWAGLYPEKDIIEKSTHYDDKENTFAVNAQLIEDLWEDCIYDRMIVSLLLNTTAIRRKIGIRKNQLRGGMTKMWEHDIFKLSDLKRVKGYM